MSLEKCGAKTRKGGVCRQPAMANRRCRLHGGYSTGPRTVEGKLRIKLANTKHGFYSIDNVLLRKELRFLADATKNQL